MHIAQRQIGYRQLLSDGPMSALADLPVPQAFRTRAFAASWAGVPGTRLNEANDGVPALLERVHQGSPTGCPGECTVCRRSAPHE